MSELVSRPLAASAAPDALSRPWGIWLSMALAIAAEAIRNGAAITATWFA